MLHVAIALLMLILLTPAHSKASETHEVCGLLLEMRRLALHSPAGADAPRRLDGLMVALRRINHEGFFMDRDLGKVEAHASALQQHWRQAQRTKPSASRPGAPDLPAGLLRSNGCFKASAARANGSDTGQGLELDLKSNPAMLGTPGSGSNAIPELVASPHFLSIAAIMAGLAGLLGVAWQLDRHRRLRSLQPCSTTALLVYGDNCTVSKLTRIGRSGAQLQAPSVPIPATGLDLYVAGRRIPARKQWDKKFFLGLDFAHPISAEAVQAIARSSFDSGQLDAIAENATPCFFPGCHHDCDSHRATALSRNCQSAQHSASPQRPSRSRTAARQH